MTTNSGLRSLYSAVREGKLQQAREWIFRSRLSKAERCNWYRRAAIDGQNDVADMLLHNGLQSDSTPLQTQDGAAAERAKTDLIVELTKKIAEDDDLPASIFMDLAIREDSVDLVSVILLRGVEIHAVISGPLTAIQRAVMLGRPRIVDTLLAAGADVNSKHEGSTLLHSAVFRDDEEITDLLLQYGAEIDAERESDGTTALYTAVEKGSLSIVRKLIDAGASFDAKFSKNTLDPLKKSIIRHTDIIFMQSGVKISELTTGRYTREGAKNWTLLHLAAERGHRNIVELLLKTGVEVDAYDNYCKTPLYWAALNQHEEVVRLLCRHGADIDATDCDKHTPLHCFAIGGKLESARIVIKFGADMDAETVAGHSVFCFAKEYQHPRIVKLLLSCGVKNTTSLHREPAERYMFQLLQYGFREFPGLPRKDAKLLNAIFMFFEPRVRLLLEQGANVDTVASDLNGRSALLIAADRGDVKIVDTLLEFGADSRFMDSGFRQRSALHIAAEKGFYQVVEVLLTRGADTELRDNDGVTPLLLAVLEGAFPARPPRPDNSCMGVPPDYLKTIKLLLKFGADFNAVDDHRRTPLNLAAFRLERPEPLKIILEYGNADALVVPEAIANQLFDEMPRDIVETMQPGGSRFRWGEEDNGTTEEALIRHFIKMKAAQLYSSEANYAARLFNDPQETGAFRHACQAEVKKMRNMEIGNTAISFYDLLTTPILGTAEILHDDSLREAIVETLNTNDYSREFPIYGNMLYHQLEKGMVRKRALEQINA